VPLKNVFLAVGAITIDVWSAEVVPFVALAQDQTPASTRTPYRSAMGISANPTVPGEVLVFSRSVPTKYSLVAS
jgi:hypothetical protein